MVGVGRGSFLHTALSGPEPLREGIPGCSGHSAGPELLVQFCTLQDGNRSLNKSQGANDIPGRVGGQEFSLVGNTGALCWHRFLGEGTWELSQHVLYFFFFFSLPALRAALVGSFCDSPLR